MGRRLFTYTLLLLTLCAAAAAQTLSKASAQVTQLGPKLNGIPPGAISQAHSYVIAYNGESYFFNPLAGISNAPFLPNVFKPFGFSYDSHYFLYLKSNGRFPAFSLYAYDVTNATERKLTGDSVHHAVWSPTALEIAYVSLDGNGGFHLSLLDLQTGTSSEVFNGLFDLESLEWSPDGTELLYVSLNPLTKNYIHDPQFERELNRYQVSSRST